MALGIKKGDAIALIAKGANAGNAVRSLRKTILAIHEVGEPTRSRAAARFSETEPRHQGPDAQGKVHGVIASRGFALGRALKLQGARMEVKEQGQGISVETAEFDRARRQLRDRLRQLSQGSSATASQLLAAHLEFLDDDELIVTTKRAISEGKSAGFAWGRAIRDAAERLRALNDERIAERIDDLFDLEMQMLQLLSGTSVASERVIPERAVLIADDLKPSQLIALEPGRIVGICLARGGPTSHVALLAASMGIPMLVALGSSILEAQEGAWIIVNAEEATVSLAPSTDALAVAQSALDLRERRTHSERAAAKLEARTLEGTRIEVFANLASVAEAHVALNNGAEGCGLLRTEFLFLERATPPDEEEQLRQYQGIAGALEGRPLIIRTLDVGGDKPIAYLPLPAEDNPALGLRGVRTSLWRADLLRVQLRAILQVKPASQCRVLLPMITDTGEIHAVRRILDEVQQELGREGTIPLGAMIETPASALLASRLLREVDFLSIGTNDLTQYTLAMDRGHSDLAHRIDGLHPAVLTLIASVARAGDEHKKLVAVCGGLASEPTAVPLLLGLGVRELSVVPTLVPQTKALIRSLRMDSCERLAHRALELETAEQVRALANEFAQSQSRVTS
jgi:phosphoenolpyruvate-protein phosphotransferase